MSLEQIFGRNVRQRRRELGLSQEALAHDVGLAVSYLGQIERGQRNTTLSVVERISGRLDVPAPVLLQESYSA